MIFNVNIETTITEMKAKVIQQLSLLLFTAMIVLFLIASFASHLIPEDEIPVHYLINLTAGTALLFLGSALLANRKLNLMSSIFFFGTIYGGVLIAILLNPVALVFQNSIIILLTANLIASFILNRKELLLNLILSILLIDLSLFFLNLDPSKILFAFIFFHIFAFSSFWISSFKNRLEEYLLTTGKRDAKLREIGYISGSIVHEINNPLSILINSQKKLQKILDESDLNEEKNNILKFFNYTDKGIQRIDDIVKSMYGLIKSKDSKEKSLISISEIISDLRPYIEEFQTRYQTPIHINTNTREELYLLANSSEIIQIITNLVKNSCIYTATIENAEVWINFIKDGKSLLIYVQDMGNGPPEKIAVKLGEAFNTGSSEGLGLGLSISMALAAKNKGELEYVKGLDKTTFSLNLKLCQFSSFIPNESIDKISISNYATLILLKTGIVVIIMDEGKYKLTLEHMKQMIQDQLELTNYQTPYPYIVITRSSEMSFQGILFFNSSEMKNRFISGALVGQSTSNRRVMNFFTKIFKLPYPVHSFSDYHSALEWTQKKLNAVEASNS